MFKRSRTRGFSILELLIVVAIIGLLASVLIPNLIEAMNKARQKRSLSDMKGIGVAWMSWLADHTAAASAGAIKTYNSTGFVDITYVQLNQYLRPTDTFFYAQELPQTDAWKSEYRFSLGADLGTVNRLLMCAPARDGALDECAKAQIPVGPFITTDYDQDLVWADGYFLRWPEGLAIR